MSTLTVRLSDEDEQKLGQIVTAMRSDKSDVVRKLITDQWVALQVGRTFVERRGGHPKSLGVGAANLSSRDQRKTQLGEYFESKAKTRAKSK